MDTIQVVLEEKLITGEELYRMPDVGRCELIEGRLVMMSPTGKKHGTIEVNITTLLKIYAKTQSQGKVQGGEIGIYIRRDPDTVRGADALYISNERYAQSKSESFLDVAPELIVEVLSPDDRWSEVTCKLEDYFSIGVVCVWVVEPATHSVFAYRSLTNLRRYVEADTITEEDILPGFALPVAEIFQD